MGFTLLNTCKANLTGFAREMIAVYGNYVF